MAYERVNWENLPSTNTPVNADNLNKLNDAIDQKADSSDVYTKTETDTKLNKKQEKLTAGTGIEITGENIINNIQENYSTNEQKIGKWINGKPIYRQTFGFNVPNYGTETYFNWTESFYTNSISNVDEIINVKSFYKRSDNTYQPVPNNHSQSSTWASGIYDFSGTGFRFWAGNLANAFTINYLIVTIEYTKTTD